MIWAVVVAGLGGMLIGGLLVAIGVGMGMNMTKQAAQRAAGEE